MRCYLDFFESALPSKIWRAGPYYWAPQGREDATAARLVQLTIEKGARGCFAGSVLWKTQGGPERNGMQAQQGDITIGPKRAFFVVSAYSHQKPSCGTTLRARSQGSK